MVAFASSPSLPTGLKQASQLCSCPARRAPHAVLDNAKALDQVVRGWFSSPSSGKGRNESTSNSKVEEPPLLSSEISGPLAASDAEAHYLLSTTIVARRESAVAMSVLLAKFSTSAAKADPADGVLGCAVNQSDDDPACFILFERFRGPAAMTKHQKGEVYQMFIRSAQPLLEKPFGMHLCKEIGGKISLSYHPFGPAGMFILRLTFHPSAYRANSPARSEVSCSDIIRLVHCDGAFGISHAQSQGEGGRDDMIFGIGSKDRKAA
jgi:quinol monooxygenase YgiN